MSLRLRYKTEPHNLSFVKNLLEGYDDLAVMSAIDPKEGIFELICPAGLQDELKKVVCGIKREVRLKELRNI